MAKFICNKLGRDKGLEGFKSDGITVRYKQLASHALCEAIKHKLIEEAQEVVDANNEREILAELADVLEVIEALSAIYGISMQEVTREKEKKHRDRGGFQTGLYIETIEMEDDNPKVEHFRKSPDKYPEF